MSKSSNHHSVLAYVNGYGLSLYLTLTAYFSVRHHWFSRTGLMALLSGLAIVQFAVQLFFFLHLGQEDRPRWKLYVFLFMLVIVCTLVFGSLWIMNNLAYHHPTTSTEINKYLKSQDGL